MSELELAFDSSNSNSPRRVETKYRKGAFLLFAEINSKGFSFQAAVEGRELVLDSRPVLVMVTGTQQKIDTVSRIVKPGVDGSLVRGVESFNRIDVTEIDGRTGGEIVLHKVSDFAKKMWRVLEHADDKHRKAVVDNRVFVVSDTKMGLSEVGGKYKPVHKLRTELADDGVVLNENNLTVSFMIDGESKTMELVEFLPVWWVNKLTTQFGNGGVVARWSTGNAALKFVRNKKGEYTGDTAVAYGDSKASILLPSRMVMSKVFWEKYLEYGMKKRNGSVSVHLGASYGILAEDIVKLVTSGETNDYGLDGGGVGVEELNLRLPKLPEGVENNFAYLENHAKGAANEVVNAVLDRIMKVQKKGIYPVGTRECVN